MACTCFGFQAAAKALSDAKSALVDINSKLTEAKDAMHNAGMSAEEQKAIDDKVRVWEPRMGPALGLCWAKSCIVCH